MKSTTFLKKLSLIKTFSNSLNFVKFNIHVLVINSTIEYFERLMLSFQFQFLFFFSKTQIKKKTTTSDMKICAILRNAETIQVVHWRKSCFYTFQFEVPFKFHSSFIQVSCRYSGPVKFSTWPCTLSLERGWNVSPVWRIHSLSVPERLASRHLSPSVGH